MSDERDDRQPESNSEYISEAEVHGIVAAFLGRDRWRLALREAENRGFPKIDPLFGGRSRSKIRAWLDSYNKVEKDAPISNAQIPDIEDGQETFDAAPKRQARVQARPPRATVLDREAGQARPNGVSGSVHRLAARRQ